MTAQVLNFDKYEETDVLLAKLQAREFDVRAAAITNLNAVNEMRIEGNLGKRRPPYVTTDLIVVDGRHLIDAWEREDPPPTMIRVRMMHFSWEALTKEQQAYVKAWALKQNAPNKGEGYREFYKTEDVVAVIRDFYNQGFEKEDIRAFLSDVLPNKFKTAHKVAETSFNQRKIHEVRKIMLKENLTPEEAKMLLPARLHEMFMAAVSGRRTREADRYGAKHLRSKQTMLKKALIAVDRYAKVMKTKLGEPGYSPYIVRQVIEYHKNTITSMAARASKVFDVIEKEILAMDARETRIHSIAKTVKVRKKAAHRK